MPAADIALSDEEAEVIENTVTVSDELNSEDASLIEEKTVLKQKRSCFTTSMGLYAVIMRKLSVLLLTGFYR